MLNQKILILVVASLFVKQVIAQDLLETYQLALENEPVRKSAFLNTFETAELKSQSIAQMLPNISAGGSSTKLWLNSKKNTFQGNGSQDFWNHVFAINLIQPVFHWDHWVQLSLADNRIAQVEAQYQAAEQALIVKITEAYFNILTAQDNLKFILAEKEAIQTQLKQATVNYKVGIISITAVHEAQAAYDQATANEIDAINLIDDRKEELRNLIGENEASLNLLQAKISLSPPEPADLPSWSKAAENNNFKIVAQLNQTEVARKHVELQKSGHLPTVDIIGSYGVVDNNSSFSLRGDAQSIGVQLNVPIFQGGAVNSRTRQAQYQLEREKENLIKVKRDVTLAVRNAYRDVVTSLSRIKALNSAVISSESALNATKAGLEVGTRTMVDVLTEQRNLYRSKSLYAQSRYDYLVNGIRLKNAAGSLSEADLENINQYLIH